MELEPLSPTSEEADKYIMKGGDADELSTLRNPYFSKIERYRKHLIDYLAHLAPPRYYERDVHRTGQVIPQAVSAMTSNSEYVIGSLGSFFEHDIPFAGTKVAFAEGFVLTLDEVKNAKFQIHTAVNVPELTINGVQHVIVLDPDSRAGIVNCARRGRVYRADQVIDVPIRERLDHVNVEFVTSINSQADYIPYNSKNGSLGRVFDTYLYLQTTKPIVRNHQRIELLADYGELFWAHYKDSCDHCGGFLSLDNGKNTFLRCSICTTVIHDHEHCIKPKNKRFFGISKQFFCCKKCEHHTVMKTMMKTIPTTTSETVLSFDEFASTITMARKPNVPSARPVLIPRIQSSPNDRTHRQPVGICIGMTWIPSSTNPSVINDSQRCNALSNYCYPITIDGANRSEIFDARHLSSTTYDAYNSITKHQIIWGQILRRGIGFIFFDYTKSSFTMENSCKWLISFVHRLSLTVSFENSVRIFVPQSGEHDKDQFTTMFKQMLKKFVAEKWNVSTVQDAFDNPLYRCTEAVKRQNEMDTMGTAGDVPIQFSDTKFFLLTLKPNATSITTRSLTRSISTIAGSTPTTTAGSVSTTSTASSTPTTSTAGSTSSITRTGSTLTRTISTAGIKRPSSTIRTSPTKKIAKITKSPQKINPKIAKITKSPQQIQIIYLLGRDPVLYMNIISSKDALPGVKKLFELIPVAHRERITKLAFKTLNDVINFDVQQQCKKYDDCILEALVLPMLFSLDSTNVNLSFHTTYYLSRMIETDSCDDETVHAQYQSMVKSHIHNCSGPMESGVDSHVDVVILPCLKWLLYQSSHEFSVVCDRYEMIRTVLGNYGCILYPKDPTAEAVFESKSIYYGKLVEQLPRDSMLTVLPFVSVVVTFTSNTGTGSKFPILDLSVEDSESIVRFIQHYKLSKIFLKPNVGHRGIGAAKYSVEGRDIKKLAPAVVGREILEALKDPILRLYEQVYQRPVTPTSTKGVKQTTIRYIVQQYHADLDRIEYRFYATPDRRVVGAVSTIPKDALKTSFLVGNLFQSKKRSGFKLNPNRRDKLEPGELKTCEVMLEWIAELFKIDFINEYVKLNKLIRFDLSALWNETKDKIIKIFINEITTSFDLGLFQQQQPYPIFIKWGELVLDQIKADVAAIHSVTSTLVRYDSQCTVISCIDPYEVQFGTRPDVVPTPIKNVEIKPIFHTIEQPPTPISDYDTWNYRAHEYSNASQGKMNENRTTPIAMVVVLGMGFASESYARDSEKLILKSDKSMNKSDPYVRDRARLVELERLLGMNVKVVSWSDHLEEANSEAGKHFCGRWSERGAKRLASNFPNNFIETIYFDWIRFPGEYLLDNYTDFIKFALPELIESGMINVKSKLYAPYTTELLEVIRTTIPPLIICSFKSVPASRNLLYHATKPVELGGDYTLEFETNKLHQPNPFILISIGANSDSSSDDESESDDCSLPVQVRDSKSERQESSSDPSSLGISEDEIFDSMQLEGINTCESVERLRAEQKLKIDQINEVALQLALRESAMESMMRSESSDHYDDDDSCSLPIQLSSTRKDEVVEYRTTSGCREETQTTQSERRDDDYDDDGSGGRGGGGRNVSTSSSMIERTQSTCSTAATEMMDTGMDESTSTTTTSTTHSICSTDTVFNRTCSAATSNVPQFVTPQPRTPTISTVQPMCITPTLSPTLSPSPMCSTPSSTSSNDRPPNSPMSSSSSCSSKSSKSSRSSRSSISIDDEVKQKTLKLVLGIPSFKSCTLQIDSHMEYLTKIKAFPKQIAITSRKKKQKNLTNLLVQLSSTNDSNPLPRSESQLSRSESQPLPFSTVPPPLELINSNRSQSVPSISSTGSIRTGTHKWKPSYCDLFDFIGEFKQMDICCGTKSTNSNQSAAAVQNPTLRDIEKLLDWRLTKRRQLLAPLISKERDPKLTAQHLFKSHIVDLIVSAGDWNNNKSSTSSKRLIALIDGTNVCVHCYATAFGVSYRTVYRDINRVRTGDHECRHGNTVEMEHVGTKDIKFMNAVTSIESYLQLGNSDMLPDRQSHQMIERTDQELYQNILNLQPNDSNYQFSKSTFIRALKEVEKRTNTTIRVNQTKAFATCDICARCETQIKNLQKQKPIDSTKVTAVQNQKDQHNEQQRQERAFFYESVKRSKMSPNVCWTFMEDGMDQQKTSLPVRTIGGVDGTTKTTECSYFVPTHLTGITMSGAPYNAVCFVNCPDFLNDSMLNVECLHRALIKCKLALQNPSMNPRSPSSNHRRWPLELVLQADNAANSCKNVQMIGYLAILVHYGIFEKIRMSFMIKGHTHDQVDQFFSRIAVHLRNVAGCNTMEHMMSAVEKSYQGTAVELIDSVANTKDWIYKTAGVQLVRGHETPHVFEFYKRQQIVDDPLNVGRAMKVEQTVVSTKFLSDGLSYADPTPNVLLQGDITILPDPTPVPMFSLQYNDISKMVQTFVTAGEFSPSDVKSWNKFISNHQQQTGAQCETCQLLRKEQAGIGTITNKVITEEEKNHRRDQQKRKREVQKKMMNHLQESTDHPTLTGWWTNALPQAGTDLEYITTGFTAEQLESMAQSMQVDENENQEFNQESNLESFGCEQTGRLIEPTQPMIQLKSTGKQIDIGMQLKDLELKSGMIVFLIVPDARMLYRYRPAIALSDILYRLNDIDSSDPNQYSYIKLRYYDRSEVPRAEQVEWKQRLFQHHHNLVGDGRIHPTSKQKPILLIISSQHNEYRRIIELKKEYEIIHYIEFSSVNSTVTTQSTCTGTNTSTGTSAVTGIHTIIGTQNSERDAKQITIYMQQHYKGKILNAILIDYLHIETRTFIDQVIVPFCTLMLPWLYIAGMLCQNQSLIYLPNVFNIIQLVTGGKVSTSTSTSNKMMKSIYGVQPVSDSSRIPLIRIATELLNEQKINVHEQDSNCLKQLNEKNQFISLKFLVSPSRCSNYFSPTESIPQPSSIPPPPTSTSTPTPTPPSATGAESVPPSNRRSHLNKKKLKKSTRRSKRHVQVHDDDDSSSNLSDSSSGNEIEPSIEEKEIESNNSLKRTLSILSRTTSTSLIRSTTTTSISKVRQRYSTSAPIQNVASDYQYKEGELVDVCYSRGDKQWYPAEIVDVNPINPNTKRPFHFTKSSQGTKLSMYRIQWYWSKEWPEQLQENVRSNLIRPTLEKDYFIEIEINEIDEEEIERTEAAEAKESIVSESDPESEDDHDDEEEEEQPGAISNSTRKSQRKKNEINSGNLNLNLNDTITTTSTNTPSIRRVTRATAAATANIVQPSQTRSQKKQIISNEQKWEDDPDDEIPLISILNQNSIPTSTTTSTSTSTLPSSSSSSTDSHLYGPMTLIEMKKFKWKKEKKPPTKKNGTKKEDDWEWTDSLIYWCDYTKGFTRSGTILKETRKKIEMALNQIDEAIHTLEKS